MNLAHISESVKVAGDWLSVSVALATLAKVLPSLAAVLSIAWYLARFYDRWLAKREGRKPDLDR